MAARPASGKAVYAALVGNLLIAVTKFIVAAWTGSSAMISEGVHSLVDTGNQLLLLYGMHRAAKPPDEAQPMGYGRELYFWSFIVALLIFSIGAGISFYEGIVHIRSPVEVRDVHLTYAVLGLSMLFEGGSWLVAFREMSARKGSASLLRAVRESKDPTTFTVLFEDSAALIGLVIAFCGILAAQLTGMPEFDGAASIGIGFVLAATAIFLARETKSLLIGESASKTLENAVLDLAAHHPAVQRANGVVTIHLGPQQVVAALSLEFRDELTATAIERCIVEIERDLRVDHPQVTSLFVKPQTADQWRLRRSRLHIGGHESRP